MLSKGIRGAITVDENTEDSINVDTENALEENEQIKKVFVYLQIWINEYSSIYI